MTTHDQMRALFLALGVCVVLRLPAVPAVAQGMAEADAPQLSSQPSGERIALAKSAITAFVGRDLGADLAYVDWRSTGPLDCELLFRVDRTRSEFSVRSRDLQVTTWVLGRDTPRVAGEEAPTDDYHRRLMARYYPSVPTDRMVPEMDGQVPTRLFAFSEVTTNGVVVLPNRCTFTWDSERKRLTAIRCLHSELRIDAAPHLSRAEALKAACTLVSSWPGVTAAAVSKGMPGVRQQMLDAPRVWEDEAGVQRLVYEVEMAIGWNTKLPQSPGAGGERVPDIVPVCVDAHTGSCFLPWAQTLWPAGTADDRLSIRVGQPGTYAQFLDMQYQARLVAGHVYLCAYYLASRLWPGTVRLDGQTSTVSVRYLDHDWQCRVGSTELSGEAGVTRVSCPVRAIEGVPYLPWEMVGRITGWSLRGERDAVLGKTVSLAPRP